MRRTSGGDFRVRRVIAVLTRDERVFAGRTRLHELVIDRTAERLSGDVSYQWGHMGMCNCGHLAQSITGLASLARASGFASTSSPLTTKIAASMGRAIVRTALTIPL